jgi:hypothetical protein
MLRRGKSIHGGAFHTLKVYERYSLRAREPFRCRGWCLETLLGKRAGCRGLITGSDLLSQLTG